MLIGIVLGAVGLWFTLDALKLTRQQAHEATIINAWNVLTTPAPGNSGKKEAIETLAAAGKSLAGIDLSAERNGGAVDLTGLNINTGKQVDLSGAKFNDAKLGNATFNNVSLHGTIFDSADLDSADFSKAQIWSTKFKDCYQSSDANPPKMPKGWKAEFVTGNDGNYKRHKNEKGETDGYYINIIHSPTN